MVFVENYFLFYQISKHFVRVKASHFHSMNQNPSNGHQLLSSFLCRRIKFKLNAVLTA